MQLNNIYSKNHTIGVKEDVKLHSSKALSILALYYNFGSANILHTFTEEYLNCKQQSFSLQIIWLQ